MLKCNHFKHECAAEPDRVSLCISGQQGHEPYTLPTVIRTSHTNQLWRAIPEQIFFSPSPSHPFDTSLSLDIPRLQALLACPSFAYNSHPGRAVQRE